MFTEKEFLTIRALLKDEIESLSYQLRSGINSNVQKDHLEEELAFMTSLLKKVENWLK